MSRRRHEYRGEIRTLYEQLQPGMTREAVRQELASGKYPHLTVFDTNHDVWSVSTPAELGAGNWVLWIEFGAGRLSSLRVRTADSIDDHPAAAPPDKRTTRGSAAASDELRIL